MFLLLFVILQPKMFATSRISAVILVSRVNSANPDISRNFSSAIWIFFQISDCGSNCDAWRFFCSQCSAFILLLTYYEWKEFVWHLYNTNVVWCYVRDCDMMTLTYQHRLTTS